MKPVDFYKFVNELAQISGEIILPFFRSSLGIENKSIGFGFDPVTEADRAAESILRRHIKEAFPTHGIIGEEFGAENEDAEYVWILDPIDGTRSFMSGLPMWGTLIGLLHHGRPCYGFMHQPFTRETFSGDGQKSYWNGLDIHTFSSHKFSISTSSSLPISHPKHETQEGFIERSLRTRPCESLELATLMTTHPKLLGEGLSSFHKVEEKVRLSLYGGDCYAYCLLAAGHIDLIIEYGLKAYDIAPLIPIIQGAGGIITTWDGKDAANGGAILAAGDKKIHESAMNLLHS